jgi:hypothetical protein
MVSTRRMRIRDLDFGDEETISIAQLFLIGKGEIHNLSIEEKSINVVRPDFASATH